VWYITRISGAGSLRIAAAFMEKLFSGNVEVYFPTPSWSNHTLMFKHSGLSVQQMTCGFDIQGLCKIFLTFQRSQLSYSMPMHITPQEWIPKLNSG
jgi:aspartate/tyrosine/aromatic aminotransferase